MTLAMFLDAGYAIQVREMVRLGLPLVDALDKTRHQQAARPDDEERVKLPPAAARNDRSLQALQARMKGVRPRG